MRIIILFTEPGWEEGLTDNDLICFDLCFSTYLDLPGPPTVVLVLYLILH